jgi:hypothetical protein
MVNDTSPAPEEGGFGLPYVVRALISDIHALRDKSVPRSEHEIRWKHDDARAAVLEDAIDKLNNKVDSLVEADIPRRIDRVENTLDKMPGKILWSVSTVVGIISALVAIVAWMVAHLKIG